jgi:hypothetical protein
MPDGTFNFPEPFVMFNATMWQIIKANEQKLRQQKNKNMAF